MKIWLDLAKIEPGHFVFISIPMGDAKFVTKEKRRGRAPILSKTRNLGRYAPKFLAPAEGWWPSATDWQGLNFFLHWKNWKFLKMFCKNLCDKVSKIRNWRWPSCSFFHALCCGVLCFFCQSIFHGENHETKSAVLTTNSSFFFFFKKMKISENVLQKSLWQSFEN